MPHQRSAGFFAVLAAVGSALTPAAAQETPPEKAEIILELPVEWPNEVSGVAATNGGFSVVGDETPRHSYTWPAGTAEAMKSKDKGRVCDPEAVDVGHGPNGQQISLVLSEDFGKVYGYVSEPFAFELPSAFLESCGRGAEGMSVRWDNGEWDLVVLWEGGYLGRMHEPQNAKRKKCTPVQEVPCTADEGPYDARIVRYNISADGKTVKKKGDPITLPTSSLLKGIETQERFRATDIAWYKEQLLVLLGSMPPPEYVGKNKHQFTWIQGFNQDGSVADGLQIRLEHLLGSYREGKNWEALDVYWDEALNEHRLVLGYDAPGPSELIVFSPDFD